MRERASSEVYREPAVWQPWRHSFVIKIVVLTLLIVIRTHEGTVTRRAYYGNGHSVYGLFDVETFVRNGEVVHALASDNTVWKRVANDGRYDGAGLAVQLVNGEIRRFQLTEDAVQQTWTLRATGSTGSPSATFRYTLQTNGNVFLDGQIGDDSVELRLHAVDLKTFPLLSGR